MVQEPVSQKYDQFPGQCQLIGTLQPLQFPDPFLKIPVFRDMLILFRIEVAG